MSRDMEITLETPQTSDSKRVNFHQRAKERFFEKMRKKMGKCNDNDLEAVAGPSGINNNFETAPPAPNSSLIDNEMLGLGNPSSSSDEEEADNPVINENYYNEIKIAEDKNIALYVRKRKYRKVKKFELSEFLYQIYIKEKNPSAPKEDLIDCFDTLQAGLETIIKNIQEAYEEEGDQDLRKEIFITASSSSLRRGIHSGEL